MLFLGLAHRVSLIQITIAVMLLARCSLSHVVAIADTYVHRSGRTGRAGRAGVAVTLFADNEVQDVRRIERGVGQGFRFERGAVPSAEQVMSLAGTVAREQIKAVSDDMVRYFKESAKDLLAEDSSEVGG